MTRGPWWAGSGGPRRSSRCKARSGRVSQAILRDLEFIQRTMRTYGKVWSRENMVRTMCGAHLDCKVQDKLEEQAFPRDKYWSTRLEMLQ